MRNWPSCIGYFLSQDFVSPSGRDLSQTSLTKLRLVAWAFYPASVAAAPGRPCRASFPLAFFFFVPSGKGC